MFCVIKEITHSKVIMSDSKTSVPKASKNPDNLVTSYEQILNLEDAETYAKQAEDSMIKNTNSNQGSTIEVIEDLDSNLPNRYLVSNREDVMVPQKTAKFQVRIIDGNGGMKNHEVKVCKSEKQKLYNCSKCVKSFALLVDFTRHFKLVHENKSFQCNTCGAGFTMNDSLKRHHTTVHEKKNNFICNTCGAEFTTNGSLKRHHTTVHEKKRNFKCNICVASFGQKNGLKAHLASVHVAMVHERKIPFECNNCEARFALRVSLNEHVKSVHEKKKCFQCKKCLHIFSRRFALTRHLKTVSCLSIPASTKCNICQAYLVSEAALEIHKELSHNA